MEFKHNYIASLVIRTQGGDNEAFAELYTKTYNKVYNYARHYLRDEYLAQDAVQEIYILALKNITKIKDPELFVAWLNQISFHVCYDMVESLHGDTTDINSELLGEVVSDRDLDNPEEAGLQSDERTRLKFAIEKLNPADRQIVVLRYFNNMKIDDIVDLTGISKSTVKRKLIAAVEELKSLMEGGRQ